MNDLTMNLDQNIKDLDDRWTELNSQWSDPPGPSADDKSKQRVQITSWLDEINEKSLSLKRIKANKAAASVTVRGLTDEEKSKAQTATAALSREIKKTQVFNQFVTDVTTLLNAANTVVGTANRA